MMIIIAGSLCLGLQCLEKAQPCTTALTFGRTTWIREAQQINQLGGGDPGLVCSGEESRVVETGDQVFLLLHLVPNDRTVPGISQRGTLASNSSRDKDPLLSYHTEREVPAVQGRGIDAGGQKKGKMQ